MKQQNSHIGKLFGGAFIIFLLISCSGKSDESSLMQTDDTEFLSAFFLVTNGKDFPVLSTLEYCRNNADAYCHKALQRVLLARQRLKKLPHAEALSLVLQQIQNYCKQDTMRTIDEEAKCSGAFSAIYYFNSADDEKKIIETLSLVEDSQLTELFRMKHSWFFNRREITLWEKFAKLKLKGAWQEIFLENLHNRSPEVFGLQLLTYQQK